MKRGPIIHGVLLILALGFSYQTWTKEKKVEPKSGNFVVWSQADGAMSTLVFETKNRTVRIEKRGEGADAHYWGIETRTRKKATRKPKPKAGKDAGPSDTPEPEIITTKREFPLGDKGEELIANFSKLRALRTLGKLGEKEKKDYKIDGSVDQVTVSFAGKVTRSLVLGGRVHGKANRYIIDTDNDNGYVISGPVLSPLNSGETTLSLKKLHAYDDKAVRKATIEADGKTRELIAITVPGPKGRDGKPRGTKASWADPASPTKPDLTMANVLGHINRLRPSEYKPELKPDGMTKLVSVVYKDDAGKQLGYFHLYKKPLPKSATPPPDGAFGPSGVPAPGAPTPTRPKGAKPGPAPAKKAAPAGKKTGGLIVVEGPNQLAEWSGWNQAGGTAGQTKAKPGAAGKRVIKAKPPVKRPGVVVKPGAAKPGAAKASAKPGAAKASAKPGAAKPGAPPRAPPKNLPPHLRRPKKAAAPTAEYYVLTERTRVLGKVRAPAAQRLESDLGQLFK